MIAADDGFGVDSDRAVAHHRDGEPFVVHGACVVAAVYKQVPVAAPLNPGVRSETFQRPLCDLLKPLQFPSECGGIGCESLAALVGRPVPGGGLGGVVARVTSLFL